jgi:hypothetical protein
MVGLIILGGILLLAISGILFVNFYPSIGGSQSVEKIEIFKNSGHYEDNVFVNQIHTSMDMGFSKFMTILKDWIFGVPNQSPEKIGFSVYLINHLKNLYLLCELILLILLQNRIRC